MSPIEQLVAEELAIPADPRVTDMAVAIAARYPNAARSVLFYGSCLRESQLEGLMLGLQGAINSQGHQTAQFLVRVERLEQRQLELARHTPVLPASRPAPASGRTAGVSEPGPTWLPNRA
jgi:hypothetical protein